MKKLIMEEVCKKPFNPAKFEWVNMGTWETGCYQCSVPACGYECPGGICGNCAGFYKSKEVSDGDFILNRIEAEIDENCLLRNKYVKEVRSDGYYTFECAPTPCSDCGVTADAIKAANEALVLLMHAVALGDTRQQEYIDVFGPVVKYATKCFLGKDEERP